MAKLEKRGKGYRIRPYDEDGRRVSLTFETKEEANQVAHLIKVKKYNIKHGLEIKKPERKRFIELVNFYYENYSLSKRNWRSDKTNIFFHLVPFFRDHYIENIESFKKFKNHLAPKAVKNILVLLSSMLKVAHEKNWLEKPPVIRKRTVISNPHTYFYLKSDLEIEKFLSAAKEEDF